MALDFISLETAQGLFKKLLDIRGKRQTEIDEIAGTFGDPELLAQFYVQPNCQNHNPADFDEDDGGRAPVWRPVFDTMNQFLKEKMEKRDGRTQMFVLSDAGMGKTSLLMMLRLHQLTAFWPPGYECELLKLGDETLKTIKAIPAERRAHTVLLLDALDEDRAAWGRIKARLLELLLATKLFYRVVISCRTQFFPEKDLDPFGRPGQVVLEGFQCPMIFLSPFSNEQVAEYLQRKFPLRWYHQILIFEAARIREQRERAQKILEQMGSLQMRPMLLSHIDDLMEAKADTKWNSYRVYKAMVTVWLNRELTKLREKHPEEARLPPVEDLALACVRVAEEMQRRGSREMGEKELDDLLGQHRVIRYLREFEFGGRSLLNRNSRGEYRFSHYTIQEFLLAKAMIEGHLCLDLRLRVTDQLLRFLEAENRLGTNWGRLSTEGFDFVRHVERYWLFHDRLQDGSPGPDMVRLPGGSCWMGEGDQRHEVELRPFAVGRSPVTVAEFRRFVDSSGYAKAEEGGETWRNPGFDQGDRNPVVWVSWEDAKAYCQWLCRQTGQGYRLLTEAEWEYACRAGTETEYSFGDDPDALGEYAWYRENSGNGTHPVGEKLPSPWGFYDMHGNVWEWVMDWHDEKYDGKSPRENPKWPDWGGDRVFRGGSWHSAAEDCGAAVRCSFNSGFGGGGLGFRLARILP